MVRSLVLALVLLAVPARAQGARSTAPLVLHDAVVEVKSETGGPVLYRYATVYDPVAGTYTSTVMDTESGEEIERRVTRAEMINALPEEAEAAESLIRTDPEIGSLIDRADRGVVVSGGFAVTREEGHPCGPGSRCAMFDIWEPKRADRPSRRIRYVIVDLRTMSFVTRDANPDLDANRNSGRLPPSDH